MGWDAMGRQAAGWACRGRGRPPCLSRAGAGLGWRSMPRNPAAMASALPDQSGLEAAGSAARAGRVAMAAARLAGSGSARTAMGSPRSCSMRPPTRVATTQRRAAMAAAATPDWLASRWERTRPSAQARRAGSSASGTQRFSTETWGSARSRASSGDSGPEPTTRSSISVARAESGERVGQEVEAFIGQQAAEAEQAERAAMGAGGGGGRAEDEGRQGGEQQRRSRAGGRERGAGRRRGS